MSIAAILLAAGGSTRMGQLKQLLPYRGGTLVSHAARTLLASRCRPIVVVVGCEAARVRGALDQLDVTLVENPIWRAGIGSSIAAGVAHVSKHCPEAIGALIVPCDQPNVSAKLLDALVEAHESCDHPRPQAVACGYGDGSSSSFGVPALFDRALFEKLVAIDPRHGAKAVLAEHRPAIVNDPSAAFDVDSPQDYAQIREQTR